MLTDPPVDPQNQKLGRVKFDLLQRPAFGIPVLGHILNIPNELLAFGVSNIPALTPPGSEADRIARTEGALASWEQRQDIPWYIKLPAEVGAGLLLPGFGSIGPAGRLTKALTSPVIDAIGAGGRAIQDVPYIGKAFQLSARGQAAKASNEFGRAIGPIIGQGHDTQALLDALEAAKTGAMPAWQFADFADAGTDMQTVLRAAYEQSGARWAKLVKNDDAVRSLLHMEPATPVTGEHRWQALRQAYYNDIYRAAGGVYHDSGPLKWLDTFNRELKGLMLSGGTMAVQNTADMLGKGLFAGGGINRKFLDDLAARIQNTGKRIDEADRFYGYRPTDPSLEQDISRIYHGDTFSREGLLDKAKPWQAAGVGAGIGAIAGGPVGAGLGALGGLATKGGHWLSSVTNPFLESTARDRYFIEGAKKYLRDAIDGTDELRQYVSSDILSNRTARLDRVKTLLGPKYDDFARLVREQDYLVTPEKAQELAHSLGVTNPELRAAWRDVYERQWASGLGYSDYFHFPYSYDTNLMSTLRTFTPFPVWPVHNLQFYGREVLRNPWIGAAAAGYGGIAHEANQVNDLPARFLNKVPLVPAPGGQIWGNPLAPLSISQQLQEPPQAGQDWNTTSLDRISGGLSAVGLGITPTLSIPLQALGLIKQRQDIQDILPATRLIRPLGQMLGLNWQPEAALKAPFNLIRNEVAPGTAPEVPYADYQVRKKLAEMAFMQTGKSWLDSPDYTKAMTDPTDPLWKQATRLVGLENTLMYGVRRLTPFQATFLSDWEKGIRDQTAQAALNPDMSRKELATKFPGTNAYKNLSKPSRELALTIQSKSLQGMSPESKQLFIQQNPDLAAFVAWQERRRRQGLPATVAQYISQSQQK